MLIITIIRIVIFATFLLLVAEGIGAVFVYRWFYALYIRKHIELQRRIKALELQMEVKESDA